MRLIDADKLIEDIEKLNLELFEEFKYADSGGMKITSNAQMYIICESVLPRIKEQPTAFDVEKVVEQLEEEIKENPYQSEYLAGLYKAIDIVRQVD